MMKLALVVAGLFTVVTAALVVTALSDPKPRMDMRVAAKVFERYPHWQRSILSSHEVALDPGLARAHAAKFTPPSAFQDDPFALWQPSRRVAVSLEFGFGRLATERERSE